VRRAKTRTCAGTADKTILAPAIHIPSSHPGHQTKKHPARKAGNISRDEIKKKNEDGDPQIFADGKAKGLNRGGRGVSQRRNRASSSPAKAALGIWRLARERGQRAVEQVRAELARRNFQFFNRSDNGPYPDLWDRAWRAVFDCPFGACSHDASSCVRGIPIDDSRDARYSPPAVGRTTRAKPSFLAGVRSCCAR
jgi:hypothetical protein